MQKQVNRVKPAFITFRWNYTDPSGPDTETALVQIWRIHKPQGLTFECWILFRTGDLLEMEGVIESLQPDAEKQYRLTPETTTRIDH